MLCCLTSSSYSMATWNTIQQLASASLVRQLVSQWPAAATAFRRYCRGQFPRGANNGNTFLQVDSITGSCGTTVSEGSVAVFPNPTAATSPLRCGDDLQLVSPDNSNFAERQVDDTCPACSGGFQGTDGHVDSYSSSQACTGHDVGDLGNCWTARTN